MTASKSYPGSKLSIAELRTLADEAVKHGRWMIRGFGPDYKSPSSAAKGFAWNPPGEWTRAPDFNTQNQCGGGLHGQDATWGGYFEGTILAFCEHRGGYVAMDNKIKVEEARILLIDELPDGLVFNGELSVSGCGLQTLNAPEAVRVYVSCCTALQTLNAPKAEIVE